MAHFCREVRDVLLKQVFQLRLWMRQVIAVTSTVVFVPVLSMQKILLPLWRF